MRRIMMYLLSFAAILWAAERPKECSVAVTNPLGFARGPEVVSIDLAALAVRLPDARTADLTVTDAGKVLVSQVVDNDQDGVNDELLFLVSMAPSQKKRFMVRVGTPPVFTTVVDGRFVLPRQDFAWENDRIAFRIYGSPIAGNVLNGTDVWTKRVRYPIVKKWYDGEEQTPKIVYHEDHGEGADFFSVGRSLGAGSMALMWNGRMVQSGLFSSYRVLANGPLRISFEVTYTDLRLDTMRVLETKRITLDAGEQLNRVTERYQTLLPVDSLTVVTGIVKRAGVDLHRSKDRQRAALWGPTTNDPVNGTLGTAVILPFSSVTALEDTVHAMVSAVVPANRSITYYAGAAWSRMGDIASAQEWNAYLDRFQDRLRSPLLVTFP